MNGDYDIVIAGGGMAGISLACALAPTGARMAVIEATPPSSGKPPTFDDRAIALAHGSRRIFEAIGVWDGIARTATAINKIHVSERGKFGFTHLDAAEEGVPALGYVALARDLGETLLGAFFATGIDFHCPARVVDLDNGADRVTLAIESGDGRRQITAKLLVAADGGQSQIRERIGIQVRRWEYGHTAVVSNVLSGKPHDNIAYERFTTDGPLALLPMTGNRFGVVLTVPTEQQEAILALDDGAFMALLQERIGYRCGRFTHVGRRSAYPLSLITAKASVSRRVALLGNAAHTLHPISGQGFNLGLRDVAVLTDVVAHALDEGGDPGGPEILKAYAEARQADHRNMALVTDGLARLFGNPLGFVTIGRNLGMLAADLIPGIRHQIARHAMGLKDARARLSRGLPVDRA
ncbi:MAG: 2-octaprenyl-6-methoxyphenyl hydroxylase [Gammaproteobacteria bacterium]